MTVQQLIKNETLVLFKNKQYQFTRDSVCVGLEF